MGEPTPEWDVKTTHPLLRHVALLFLGVVILYFLAGFHMVFRDRVPHWTALSYWSMFSVGGWGNSDVETVGVFDGERRPIDLPALFPTKWESGYRWSRSSFKKNRGRMSVLGAATCQRHPEKPDRVVFTLVRWKKKLGSRERVNEKREQFLDWDCKRSVRLPGGRRLQGTK